MNLTEFVIIIALVSVAAISTMGVFGGVIKSQVNCFSLKLVGEECQEISGKDISKDQGPNTLKNYTK